MVRFRKVEVNCLPINVSVRPGEANDPQPDIALILDPDLGGQTRITDDDYIQGPPELTAEVLSAIGFSNNPPIS